MEKTKKQSMVAYFSSTVTKRSVFCLTIPILFCGNLAGQTNKTPLATPKKAQETQSTQLGKDATTLSKTLGAWRYEEEIDPMTDEKTIAYYLVSQTGNASMRIILSCAERRFVWLISTLFPVRRRSAQTSIIRCKLRFDQEEAIEESFLFNTQDITFFNLTRMQYEKYIERLSNHKILKIQIPTTRSEVATEIVTFPLDGFANCLAEMEAKSGLKRDFWNILGRRIN